MGLYEFFFFSLKSKQTKTGAANCPGDWSLFATGGYFCTHNGSESGYYLTNRQSRIWEKKQEIQHYKQEGILTQEPAHTLIYKMH